MRGLQDLPKLGPKIWRPKAFLHDAPGEPGGPLTASQFAWALLTLPAAYLILERPPLADGAWLMSVRPLVLFGILASIWFAVMRAVTFIRSRPSLAIPQDGFRYRGDVFPFGKLGEIRIRRVPAEALDVARGSPGGPIEVQTRRDTELNKPRSSRPARAHVTIVTARGNDMVFGDLLGRVTPDDFHEFVRRVEAIQPGLVRTSP